MLGCPAIAYCSLVGSFTIVNGNANVQSTIIWSNFYAEAICMHRPTLVYQGRGEVF